VKTNEARIGDRRNYPRGRVISKFAVETLEALSELEKNVSQLAELHESVLVSAQKQSQDTANVSKIFLETVAETQKLLHTEKRQRHRG